GGTTITSGLSVSGERVAATATVTAVGGFGLEQVVNHGAHLNIGVGGASAHPYIVRHFGRVNLNAGVTPTSDEFNVSLNGMLSATNNADLNGFNVGAGGNVTSG